jgi:hypothetical protein
MTRDDKSIHNFCIESIKRHTIKPYDFKWTKFYESNSDFPYSGLEPYLTENELIICSVVIDANNYSILTTQRLITKQNGQDNAGNLDGAKDKSYGRFKGMGTKGELFTLGEIQLKNGADLKYFIETTNASMVMIYGIRALLQSQEMTNTQIDKVIRIWNKQTEK